MGDLQVSPSLGTVCFGSGLHGFAFTLTKFAKMYSVKFGVQVSKLMPQLWGEKYFDLKKKAFVSKATTAEGTTLERSFCELVLKPIVALFKSNYEW
jgi:elongation factor 2